MWMPMGTQRGIATWSPVGIYMQYARYSKNSFRFAAFTLWNSLPDHFRTENSFLTSTKTKQYIFKSYMQIKRAKTVAEYLSSACRTATFSTIPGLH
jgi:hypothetical protein